MNTRLLAGLASFAALVLLAAGCGSSSASEEDQAAGGDIPDNQVFVDFTNRPAGYSLKYPEGWARREDGGRATFRDKNNVVRVEVEPGGAVTAALARADLARLAKRTPSLQADAPKQVTVAGTPAVKVTYTKEGAANGVTGKHVKLVVDRYYVPGADRHAIVDLGTPEGVDNVDAYRLMIESFRWR